MYVSVRNGTNAGWRKMKSKARDWKCDGCSKLVKHYWTRCPTCAHPRP